MKTQIPNYLRLITDTDTAADALAAGNEDLATLNGLCQSFELATGWQIEYSDTPGEPAKPNLMWSAPVNPGVGTSPGHIRLYLPDARSGEEPAVELELAGKLAKSVANMWSELLATRRALREREAELAAGVPLVVRDDEHSPSLAERLEAVLRGGAEAVGCQAAGLYLLDEATSELKLRSCWGLPQKRLVEPARPLRGSLADLEALMGHAVVIDDKQLHDYWKVPETAFTSCACAPVSSPSMPLGTLWVFSRESRDFTDVQTNLLEVVAGRLAADLERQMLVEEAMTAREQAKQAAQVEPSPQDQLPRFAPLIEGWEIAAKAYQSGPSHGTFYDWFAVGGGVSVLAGDSAHRGLEGALAASAMRATARTFCTEGQQTDQLLKMANSVLWTSSASGSSAGLFHAMLEPDSPRISLSTAGPLRVVAVSSDGLSSLAGPGAPLGIEEQVRVSELHRDLSPGDLLLVYGTSFLTDSDEPLLQALDQRLALSLEPNLNLPAEDLLSIAGQILQDYPASDPARLLLLIQRRLSQGR